MNKTLVKLFAAAALLGGASPLFAQSLVVPDQTGVINGAGQTFVVNFTSSGTAGLDFTLDAAPANVTFTSAATTVTGLVCSIPMANPQRLICNGFAASGTLPSGAVTVTYTAGATTGDVALTLSGVAFTDEMANPQMGTIDNGILTLNAGPSGPTLIYNPAPATAIVVPASISGTAVTTSIAVTQTGGDTGESTTLACTVSGTGYGATVTGSPFATGNTTAGSVGLACAGGSGAQTLTCVEDRSGVGGGAPINQTWPLTCASAPGFQSTPANGGTLNIVGIQSSTVTGNIAVSNPGTADLTVACSAPTGAGFTLGTVTSPIASGGSGVIGVTCAVPAVAGTTSTGTLACTTNAGGANATLNYNLSCLSQSASIPTLGFGGKALMVLLMLGFGLVGFQLYRRSA